MCIEPADPQLAPNFIARKKKPRLEHTKYYHLLQTKADLTRYSC
jgi:hypothetical protein